MIRFVLIFTCAFAIVAQAERGRGIVLTVPQSGDIDAFAEQWNDDLGRRFDLVAYDIAAGQTEEMLAPYELGVKAVIVKGTEDVALADIPESIEWIVIDLRDESAPQSEAIEAMSESLSGTERFLAVIPPEESALDWAPALAPLVSAYFIIETDLSAEGLEDLQYAAYSVTQSNGRCGIGCMIDASEITTTEDAQTVLEFINRTDEFIKFFAIDWNEDPAVMADLIEWLNPRIEGPKNALGMHQDRLQPPARKLDPEVDATLMRWMAIASTVFLVVILLVLFVWFKPVTRMPPDAE